MIAVLSDRDRAQPLVEMRFTAAALAQPDVAMSGFEGWLSAQPVPVKQTARSIDQLRQLKVPSPDPARR